MFFGHFGKFVNFEFEFAYSKITIFILIANINYVDANVYITFNIKICSKNDHLKGTTNYYCSHFVVSYKISPTNDKLSTVWIRTARIEHRILDLLLNRTFHRFSRFSVRAEIFSSHECCLQNFASSTHLHRGAPRSSYDASRIVFTTNGFWKSFWHWALCSDFERRLSFGHVRGCKSFHLPLQGYSV